MTMTVPVNMGLRPMQREPGISGQQRGKEHSTYRATTTGHSITALAFLFSTYAVLEAAVIRAIFSSMERNISRSHSALSVSLAAIAYELCALRG